MSDTVDWQRYAETYDLLLRYNPFYQALHDDVMTRVDAWELPESPVVLDLGAGTGNYSCALAQRLPHANVVHVDRDTGMNAVATRKRAELGLTRLDVREASAEDVDFEAESLDGAVCVHALYTFPDPGTVISRLYGWLRPGARAVLVDPGRVVKVLDWQVALFVAMVREHGLFRTVGILSQGREISRQNRKIAAMQRDGTFWTHTHDEFVRTVTSAGFEIEEARTTFRGISDFVVARRR